DPTGVLHALTITTSLVIGLSYLLHLFTCGTIKAHSWFIFLKRPHVIYVLLVVSSTNHDDSDQD
ncbi:MAG TPA: hypothetical protein P5273_10360, partial [Syntrophomonadaceae bacterium]|nr:hypothetical protein [Syntrophomonadaceae bacterium]